MWNWFKALSMRRKTLLFVGGAMLALSFNALVSLLGRASAGGVRWTEALSVAYGVVACAAVMGAAVWPVRAAMTIVKLHQLIQAVGAAGLLIGAMTLGLNVRALYDAMQGLPLTVENVAHSLTVGPSLMVPAAFTALGVLLLLLRQISRSIAARSTPPARLPTPRYVRRSTPSSWLPNGVPAHDRLTQTRSAIR